MALPAKQRFSDSDLNIPLSMLPLEVKMSSFVYRGIAITVLGPDYSSQGYIGTDIDGNIYRFTLDIKGDSVTLTSIQSVPKK